MVIKQDYFFGMLRHVAEQIWRKTEVEDEYLTTLQAVRWNLVTVIDRLVLGAITEAQPCRIRRTEAIVTIGVVENQGI